MAMGEFDPIAFTELVGHVYEAAHDVGHWGEFVGALERIHPDSRVTLFKHENGRPALAVQKNFESNDLRACRDHYVTISPFMQNGPRIRWARRSATRPWSMTGS